MTSLALVIIDMQEALVAGAYREREVLEGIRAVAHRTRTARAPVIYVQHNHATVKPLMKGEPGWQIHHHITPKAGDIIIEKTASDAFYRTELESTLRELGASTILLTGMQTEYCVDTTARAALSHGFDVVLLSDCHTTGDSYLSAEQVVAHHNALLANLAHPSHHIRVIPTTRLEFPDHSVLTDRSVSQYIYKQAEDRPPVP
jgi:nicotinamidase-related amidase